MSANDSFRPPTQAEQALLLRLLEADFEGRETLRSQADGFSVKTLDVDGSFEIKVSDGVRAIVGNSVPVQGEAEDEDGGTIHALLHIRRGLLHEVEFYKVADAPILRLPLADRWRLLVLPPPPS